MRNYIDAAWLLHDADPPEDRAITVVDVEAAVDAIREGADDDEAAHSEEDTLHQRVLAGIARGTCADPKACATAALQTLIIPFERWCA